MNQILVSKKLYITPELKRKKKVYKFNFIFSVFLVCILLSICIYAEFNRNQSEAISQEILGNMEMPEETSVAKNNVLLVVLREEDQEPMEEAPPPEIAPPEEHVTQRNKPKIQTTQNGFKYTTIARVSIPKINVNYPILDGVTDSVEETEALLKISPTKFWGVDPNEVGNMSIVGHNYRNSKFFSKVPNLVNGDVIEIQDLSGETLQYKVYDKYIVDPSDVSCTNPRTNGSKEITLITCTDDSKKRVVVKARA